MPEKELPTGTRGDASGNDVLEEENREDLTPAGETGAGLLVDIKRATEGGVRPTFKDQVRDQVRGNTPPMEGPSNEELGVQDVAARDNAIVVAPDRVHAVVAELAPEEKCVDFRDRRFRAFLVALILIVAGLVTGLAVALAGQAESVPILPTAPPTAEPSDCEPFEILEDTDIFGFDIVEPIDLSIEVDQALEECKKMCVDIPSCMAFTVVEVGARPGWYNTVPLCFVKDAFNNLVPTDGMTSGILTSTECPNVVVDFADFNATNLPGYDLFGREAVPQKVDTLDEMTTICRAICGALPKCKAFTAVDPAIDDILDSYKCWIKQGVSYMQANPYTNSGIKVPIN